MTRVCVAVLGLSLACSGPALAQQTEPQPPDFQTQVDVIGAAPLPGLDLPADQVPSPVQTATADDLDRSAAFDVSDYLNRRATAVHINEIQGNPFQADVSYRGYTASPLLGTPQGLSVYLDGVRLNQPFGDVVSWDLIPRLAIATTTMMPGSNPLFGLNTLGGALALQTKSGQTMRGTTVQSSYGQHARRNLEVEHGGRTANGSADWYLAGTLFGDDGWRVASPSTVRQVFGRLGWQQRQTRLDITAAHVDNALTGNALQDYRLLDQQYDSVYTIPDVTKNRATSASVAIKQAWSPRLLLSGNVYYRNIRTSTTNGDVNESSLDQSVYQPSTAERAALSAAGYSGVPASGASSANTPFPFWRCLGNVLLNDEPGEKCNGLINRTASRQHNEGGTAQVMWRRGDGAHTQQIVIGGGVDRSSIRFDQSTELGYINPDRSITGTGAFADGLTGGTVDGMPFDARVGLDGTQQTLSLYAADTTTVNGRWHLSGSARYNRNRIDNRDRIQPGGGEGSLDGRTIFARLNPAVGFTYDLSPHVNTYAGYSEGARAATAIELGCADPNQPCKLPNAMAGDPPLKQVVARTVEAGVRGRAPHAVRWNVGWFLAENQDDILFVAATDTGFGYFKNVGRTQRVGVEAGMQGRSGRITYGVGYTFLSATFQTTETVNGSESSSNDSALSGVPGVDGNITIEPGDRMPLVPRHTVKAYADLQVTHALSLDVDVIGVSGLVARGNENGADRPDGVYYLGSGDTPGYAVCNLAGRYRVTRAVQIYVEADNVFDSRYYTAAQLGPAAFTTAGTFIARPYPAIDGAFPVTHTTFLAPGAPRFVAAGLRVSF